MAARRASRRAASCPAVREVRMRSFCWCGPARVGDADARPGAPPRRSPSGRASSMVPRAGSQVAVRIESPSATGLPCAVGSDEQGELVPGVEERRSEPCADESAGSGDGDLHLGAPLRSPTARRSVLRRRPGRMRDVHARPQPRSLTLRHTARGSSRKAKNGNFSTGGAHTISVPLARASAISSATLSGVVENGSRLHALGHLRVHETGTYDDDLARRCPPGCRRGPGRRRRVRPWSSRRRSCPCGPGGRRPRT